MPLRIKLVYFDFLKGPSTENTPLQHFHYLQLNKTLSSFYSLLVKNKYFEYQSHTSQYPTIMVKIVKYEFSLIYNFALYLPTTE